MSANEFYPGEGDVRPRIPVYAGATEREAREESHESITFYFGRQANLTRAESGAPAPGLSSACRRASTALPRSRTSRSCASG